MLDIQILGFLDEGPLHGYELRRRIAELNGTGHPVSDGTLYPALRRLERAGYLLRREEPGARGRRRQVLHLTEAGRARLHQLPRDVDGPDLADMPRFMIVLAFLSHLPSRAERDAVLRRRLSRLESTPAFFYDHGRPVTSATESDPYRRGMLVTAGAARRAEMAWLRGMLDDAAPEAPAQPGALAQPETTVRPEAAVLLPHAPGAGALPRRRTRPPASHTTRSRP